MSENRELQNFEKCIESDKYNTIDKNKSIYLVR